MALTSVLYLYNAPVPCAIDLNDNDSMCLKYNLRKPKALGTFRLIWINYVVLVFLLTATLSSLKHYHATVFSLDIISGLCNIFNTTMLQCFFTFCD